MIRAPWIRLTSGPTIGLRELVRTDVLLELLLPVTCTQGTSVIIDTLYLITGYTHFLKCAFSVAFFHPICASQHCSTSGKRVGLETNSIIIV